MGEEASEREINQRLSRLENTIDHLGTSGGDDSQSALGSESEKSSIRAGLQRLKELLGSVEQLLLSQDRDRAPESGSPGAEERGELARLFNAAKWSLADLQEDLRAQEKERKQLCALQEVGSALNSSLETDDVLNVVMDTMIQITGAERGFLMLFDEASNKLEIRAARNINRESIVNSSEVSSTVIKSVFDTAEAVVTTNAQEDERFQSQQSIVDLCLRSIMCVPLKLKGATIGVVYADNRITSGVFGDTDRDLFSSFANQGAVAIENARLFQKIRDQLSEITEMKTLMDDVFESIASGVITIDNEDRVGLYNQAAHVILNVPRESVVNRTFGEALTDVAGELEVLVEEVRRSQQVVSREVDVGLSDSANSSTLNLKLSPLSRMDESVNGIAMVLDDVTDRKRMAAVRRYLPPALVDQVRDLDAAERPQRRDLTVFFADISNFSTFSEGLDPSELIRVINGYFTVATQAINHCGGIIDKFMGDAVMALFNTQLNPQEDHVARAVRASLEMQAAIAEYRSRQKETEQLRFSAGIHSGEAVVGNVGSHFRKDFTAIGDSVNLAKRLEEMADPGQVLISDGVYQEVRDWVRVESLGMLAIKGRNAAESAHRLLGRL